MKNLLNIGKTLNKAEQKEVNGGKPMIDLCYDPEDCPTGYICYKGACRPFC